MFIKDLTPNAQNPRTITAKKRAMLKKALREFGDLSGIIYNRTSQQLVGGHQRRELLDPNSVVTIVKKYSRPTKTGTVAEGFVELDGERHTYREVMWKPAKEKAASIAANKGAGDWDFARLGEMFKELTNFDSDINIDLTMFDHEELTNLPIPIEVAGHTRTPGSGANEEDEAARGPAKCKAGQVYALGETKLLCGADDLHYCDLIISRWEKHSGVDAVLIGKTKIKKKAAKQHKVQLHGEA
jgi:hypothetical protein